MNLIVVYIFISSLISFKSSNLNDDINTYTVNIISILVSGISIIRDVYFYYLTGNYLKNFLQGLIDYLMPNYIDHLFSQIMIEKNYDMYYDPQHYFQFFNSFSIKYLISCNFSGRDGNYDLSSHFNLKVKCCKSDLIESNIKFIRLKFFNRFNISTEQDIRFFECLDINDKPIKRKILSDSLCSIDNEFKIVKELIKIFERFEYYKKISYGTYDCMSYSEKGINSIIILLFVKFHYTKLKQEGIVGGSYFDVYNEFMSLLKNVKKDDYLTILYLFDEICVAGITESFSREIRDLNIEGNIYGI